MPEKKPLTGLFRDNPKTPEGKYLVKRRDGTVMEKPNFVLVATDPNASDTLQFYALLNLVPDDVRESIVEHMYDDIADWLGDPGGRNKEYVQAVMRHAAMWDKYRAEHGDSDPLMGQHRKDDPATIEEMKKGFSA
jgi:hypothetical protein